MPDYKKVFKLIDRQGSFVSVVKLMRASGASINDASCGGMTPLMAAARAGNVALLEEICRSFTALLVNLGDTYGQTALFYASKYPNQRTAIQMISLLFSKGADVNICAKNGDTPLQWSRRNKLFLTATHLHSLQALGPFEESEKCRTLPPKLVLFVSNKEDDESDENTQKITQSDEDESIDENDDLRNAK